MEQKELDDLRTLLATACEVLTQVMLRIELMKKILIDHGVIAGPDFEEQLKALEVGMRQTLEERARQERQDRDTERLLKYLKEFEGTKQ
jgi:hypothetical protein